MSGVPNSLVFSVMKTHDKSKVLEKDENGYYKVTLGGLNCHNSQGAYYIAEGVKELMNDPNSLIYKRLTQGYLTGEMGHPHYQPGMTKSEYLMRVFKVAQENTSHHIKAVEFCPVPNSEMIKMMGWIKPAGPKGDILEQALNNPDQNVAFSIRSITNDTFHAGRTIKKIVQIITWDWVDVPGIKEANSWDTLAMESMDLVKISLSDIESVTKELKKMNIASQESTDMIKSFTEMTRFIRLNSNSNDSFNKW